MLHRIDNDGLQEFNIKTEPKKPRAMMTKRDLKEFPGFKFVDKPRIKNG